MKVLKILTVLLLLGAQANATGFSHNMLVAHRMLNAKKTECVKACPQPAPLQMAAKPVIVKPDTHASTQSDDEEASVEPEAVAVSFSQHVARWVVRVMLSSGEILSEKLISLFSTPDDASMPANARLVSLQSNILSYLIVPLRVLF